MTRRFARLIHTGSSPELVTGWRVMRGFLEKQAGLSPAANFISEGVGCRRKFREHDRPLSLDEIENEILLDDAPSFSVGLGGVHEKAIARAVGYQRDVAGDTLFTLSFESEDAPDWSPLMAMSNAVLNLVYGYSHLQSYVGWQLESDIRRYEKNYGSAESRPKIIKGPPPLDGLAIDTSRNPGREVQENGEFQGVAADMWFAPRFWERRKLTPEDVVRAVPSAKAEDAMGLTRIRSFPREFDRPDGEQGEIQKALWKVLFDREVEW